MAEALKKWKCSEVTSAVSGKCAGDTDWVASRVETDTRTLQAGSLYFALKGSNFDGNDFLKKAQEAGAVAAVVDYWQDIDLPQIVVKDTLKALQDLAAYYRNQHQALFIGLTGSNGKTSTKEMLLSIFSEQGKAQATKGNLNNEIGVPLTILNIKPDTASAIIEMGANHINEIEKLTKIVNPDIAMVNNVAAAHLEGFGSIDGVIKGKSEIYEYSHGKVIINLDLPCSAKWVKEYAQRQMLTFSMEHTNTDIYLKNANAEYDAFTVSSQNEDAAISWQLKGRHNVNNALAAISVALMAGIPLSSASKALHNFTLQQSRLMAIKLGKYLLYDDTYNANPASFKAGIDVICKAKSSLVIAGAMGELGKDSAKLHAGIADYALEQGIQRFWALNAPEYAQHSEKVSTFENIEDLYKAITVFMREKDRATILVKGSRSAKMERVVGFIVNNKD